jgi:flavodoxin
MQNSLKKLVVYYSLGGNTAFVANTIAEAGETDLLELQPKKSLQSKGFLRYFLAGMQMLLNKKPELQPLSKDPADYDLIFLGTPVWAGNYTPPLRTLFSMISLKGKKFALFCCCGNNAGKSLENMKQELSGNSILDQMVFRNPLKDKDNSAAQAVEWAKKIVSEAS